MTASGIKNKTPTDGTRQGLMKVSSPERDINSLERNVNSLSIIIPTLNEAQTIGGLLDQLRMQADINLDIILVDGGSTDATLSIAESQVASGKQVRLMQTEPGRGRQMNAGAEMAKHDWLLFLHCDSTLTCPVQLRDALGSLKAASDQGQAVAGHFPLAFDARDPELKRRLGFFEAKTRLNRPGTFNGDQGLMISRGHFRQAGCFPCDLPFLEDQAFAANFRSIGSFITLPLHPRHISKAIRGRRFCQARTVERRHHGDVSPELESVLCQGEGCLSGASRHHNRDHRNHQAKTARHGGLSLPGPRIHF